LSFGRREGGWDVGCESIGGTITITKKWG